MEQKLVQIRHRMRGPYQGTAQDGHYWYPFCEAPWRGVAALMPHEARHLVRAWMGHASRLEGSFVGAREEDFAIEPFDPHADQMLRSVTSVDVIDC